MYSVPYCVCVFHLPRCRHAPLPAPCRPFRVQLVPCVRRLNASFVGQVHRVLWEGGHIVALLRGMHGSTELRMRVKHDVLTVQVRILC